MKNRIMGRWMRNYRKQMGYNTRDNTLGEPELRTHIASLMMDPMKQRIYKESILRALIGVQQMPEGALPNYGAVNK